MFDARIPRRVSWNKMHEPTDFASGNPAFLHSMIDVESAIALIRETALPLPQETVGGNAAVGRVLAAALCADLDAPPFDKSMMDGYAIQSRDFDAGRREFDVVGFLAAGSAPQAALRPHGTVHIMTGAVVPQGADAVVMQEEVDADPAQNRIILRSARVRQGQNILRQGSIYRAGDVILPAGHRVSANDLGLIAECSQERLCVQRLPAVAILATGNELVASESMPPGGRIRNSNGPLLIALTTAQHATPRNLGACEDTLDALRAACADGLQSDVLILTGGVSAGQLDLVPSVLQELGVRQIFHKLPLKPGKPIWFGLFEQDARRCLVFGLPGNPVSTFVCFQLFVRVALRELVGEIENRADASATKTKAILTRSHEIRGDRPTYWPSRVEIHEGRALVEPLDWKGSADQRCLSRCNCLVVFPIGNHVYPDQTLVEILPV